MLQSSASRITTSAKQGEGGAITITAGENVFLNNGTLVAADSSGPKNAGSIRIEAGSTIQVKDSSVTTEAEGAAGGNINLQATDLVLVLNSEISASANGDDSEDGGGNVTIDPIFVVLIDSAITAKAKVGKGGNITITADFFFKDEASVLDASSETGIDGEVVINSPFETVTTEVNILEASFLDVAGLLSQRCAAVAASERSSFTVASRGGVPRAPDSYIPSALEDVQPRGQLSQSDLQNSEKLLQLAEIQPNSGDWAKQFRCA
jgi:large exoprotein involved in heme utilization and adhesion